MADHPTSSPSSTPAPAAASAAPAASDAAPAASGAAATATLSADAPAKRGAAVATATSSARDTAPATAADGPPIGARSWPGAMRRSSTRCGDTSTPQAYADAGFQLRQMIDSRQLKAPLAADAAPDEVAKWRHENGIPQEAAGYLAKLDRGLVTSEADQRLVAPFLEAMLVKNAPPDTVNAALGAWRQIHDRRKPPLEQDAHAKEAAAETLRPEWGGAYQRNLNTILGYLDTAPSGVKDALLNARLASGQPLASAPNILRFLLSAASSANPAATVVPGSSGTTQATLASRIAEIETLMRDNRAEYNRNTAMQQELLKLYAARDKKGVGEREGPKARRRSTPLPTLPLKGGGAIRDNGASWRV